MKNPFRYFKTSPEIIRLAVMMYVRFPLSLRNVEELLHERGIEVSHETIRFWWNRVGPIFAAEIRKKRMDRMRAFSAWQWHLDEVFVKINGERHYLWRAVDPEGEVLEAFVSTSSTTAAAASTSLSKLVSKPNRSPPNGRLVYELSTGCSAKTDSPIQSAHMPCSNPRLPVRISPAKVAPIARTTIKTLISSMLMLPPISLPILPHPKTRITGNDHRKGANGSAG